jgi:hypothetical protein
MELADVSEIVPDANVLGQVHGRPTIGDDVTTGGKRLAMTDDLLNLTLLVDTADAVTGFALDAIPDDWKSGVTTITAAHIGNSVTSIGSSAFYRCTALTSITITSVPAAAWTGTNGLFSTTLLTDINITADVFNQYDGAWRTAQGVDPSVTLNSI